MLQIVAIDGISGSGKSSTARLLAQALGFRHLDTGAMYRLHAFTALQAGLRPDEYADLARAAEKLRFSFGAEGALLADGRPLPDSIRSPEVSAVVSEYCKPKEVRTVMVQKQRELALAGPTVVEGRDIGTVVFPDAPWKFFMVAKPEVRAYRRAKELAQAGHPVRYEDILQNLRERDSQDSSRANAPLLKAADAVEVDTSDYTLEQQVAMLSNLVLKGSP